MVVGEWEEQSPWAPLGERRGAGPDAVTGFVATGTADVADVAATDGGALADVIARSVAYPGTALMISPWAGDVVVVLCPTWAQLIAKDLGEVAAVQERLFASAVVPRDDFPRPTRTASTNAGCSTPGAGFGCSPRPRTRRSPSGAVWAAGTPWPCPASAATAGWPPARFSDLDAAAKLRLVDALGPLADDEWRYHCERLGGYLERPDGA